MGFVTSLMVVQVLAAVLGEQNREAELCRPSPCGNNAFCTLVNETPTCKCLPGYHGSPIVGCRHECDSDTECRPSLACIDFKCQNPCSQCGINAECDDVRNHRPVCTCPRNYTGNPLVSCQPECSGDVDCPSGRPACSYGICKNPCDGVCGVSADCTLRGLTPVCSCPKDMTGDPFIRCRPFDKRDLCEPNPCGANAGCELGYDKMNKQRPVCTCYPGYIGDPLTGCKKPSCSECGKNAQCDVRNNQTVCTCPKNYIGNPLVSCQPECSGDVDCPLIRPACFHGICKNPCDGVCGVSADCNLRGLTPICSCPRDMTGDPFIRCRPFDKRDLCEPNPCGANAGCEPGYDKMNKQRPVCTCYPGYFGDPLAGCQKASCSECGKNAQCDVRNCIVNSLLIIP